MLNILKNTTGRQSFDNPWVLLLILIAYVVVALIGFSVISQLLIAAIYGYDLSEIAQLLTNPEKSSNARGPIMLMQGITSVGMFVATPVFFIYLNLHLRLKEFLQVPPNALRPVFMTVLIMLCFMISNSIIIEWNQGIDLPQFLNWFEDWAQQKELQLKELTEYLTSFTDPMQFLVGIFVIAIIPAIGEELLFRGLIQNLFQKIFRNHHTAIWLAAFLFGVMHFQFYGVIPRILLGALFGYLYHWSGSLPLAMLGHFINNGLTLILLYLSQLKILDFDPTDANTSPPFYVIIIFFVGGSALLYLFNNYFKTNTNE